MVRERGSLRFFSQAAQKVTRREESWRFWCASRLQSWGEDETGSAQGSPDREELWSGWRGQSQQPWVESWSQWDGDLCSQQVWNEGGHLDCEAGVPCGV